MNDKEMIKAYFNNMIYGYKHWCGTQFLADTQRLIDLIKKTDLPEDDIGEALMEAVYKCKGITVNITPEKDGMT